MTSNTISSFKKFTAICRDVFVYFMTTDGSLKAAGLAYVTLVSIVPLMVLSIGFLIAFPQFAVYLQNLHHFLFRHLVPGSAHIIQNYVEAFANNATNLSASSLIFFLLTAVLLIFNMETAFNSIWRVKSRRHGLSFLMYWAILTLVPPAGSIALAASMYLYTVPTISSVIKVGASILPLIITWLGFLLLYMTLPNCKVQFRHAAVGAVIAASLFEVLKTLFRVYSSYFSSDTIVYGVIAAIPSFLLWLYFFWLITIFGAVISYIVSIYGADLHVTASKSIAKNIHKQ